MWRHRHPPYGGGHFHGRGHFMGGPQNSFGPSIPLLITALWVALLLLLVCALLIWFSRKKMPKFAYYSAPPSSQPRALDILRQRYARGEIDDVTFQNMHERLEALDARERPPND